MVDMRVHVCRLALCIRRLRTGGEVLCVCGIKFWELWKCTSLGFCRLCRSRSPINQHRRLRVSCNLGFTLSLLAFYRLTFLVAVNAFKNVFFPSMPVFSIPRTQLRAHRRGTEPGPHLGPHGAALSFFQSGCARAFAQQEAGQPLVAPFEEANESFTF